MPTLSCEGESHDEILPKVRRWIVAAEGDGVQRIEKARNVAVHAMSAAVDRRVLLLLAP